MATFASALAEGESAGKAISFRTASAESLEKAVESPSAETAGAILRLGSDLEFTPGQGFSESMGRRGWTPESLGKNLPAESGLAPGITPKAPSQLGIDTAPRRDSAATGSAPLASAPTKLPMGQGSFFVDSVQTAEALQPGVRADWLNNVSSGSSGFSAGLWICLAFFGLLFSQLRGFEKGERRRRSSSRRRR